MKWYEKLLRWGFCTNYWVWFHILVGGLIANVCSIWLPGWLSALVVFIAALVWEGVEFYFESDMTVEEIRKTYGSVERWIYDSIGDVLGAVACGIIVVV